MDSNALSMLKYIMETPAQVRSNIKNAESLTAKMVSLFAARPYKSVWLVACGSSCNAAHCARYYMREYLGVEVKVITPFTFNHYEHDMDKDDFVVCISQSGCSTNTVESLRLCKKLGVPAIGLTGNVHSDFEREADDVVDYGLGEEKLDFVSKGVVTLMVFLMLFALYAARAQGRINNEQVETEKAQMLLGIDNYEEQIRNFPAYFEANKQKLLSMERVYVIGAGANYGTALEGAVKIGETVHIVAVGYEVDEAIHGPQIQLTPNYNFIFIDPGDETAPRIQQSYKAARAMTDRVFILSNNPEITGKEVMRVTHAIKEKLTPLYTLAFIPLISYYVAETNSTWKQHPLMKDYKEILSGKSATYQAYDCT